MVKSAAAVRVRSRIISASFEYTNCVARQEVFFLGKDAGMRGNLERKAQQRKRRQQFHERRMLGIIPEIAVRPIVVAGEDVAGFIPGLGFAARGQDELAPEDHQQTHSRCDLQTARGGGRKHGDGAVYSSHRPLSMTVARGKR